MPQLLLLIAVGAIALVGYRALTKEAQRVSARVRREEAELKTKAHGTLVRDPETGEYRLPRD